MTRKTRRAKAMNIQDSVEKWILKKKFIQEERGGISIEEQEDIIKRIEEKSQDAIKELEALTTLPPDVDLFLDTNFIEGRPGGTGLYRYYHRFVGYLSNRDYNKIRPKFLEAMTSYSETVSKLLLKDNIFIITNVLKEISAYKKIIKDRINNKTHKKFLLPIKTIYTSAVENNCKLDCLEDDPLIDRLYNLIPNIYKGNKELSETDRKLIAVPLARALDDRRNKLIATYDIGIRSALSGLYALLQEKPHILRIGDLVSDAWNFPEIKVGIYGKGLYYNDFFLSCHLFRSKNLQKLKVIAQ